MATDFSTIHKPVGELFVWPRTSADWDQYRLTNEQVEFFHANGYLPRIRVLNDEQIEAFLSAHPEFTLEAPPIGAVPSSVLDGPLCHDTLDAIDTPTNARAQSSRNSQGAAIRYSPYE